MMLVDLPLVGFDVSPVATLHKLEAANVSACVVTSDNGGRHHLLLARRVVESLNEWSHPPTNVGQLIVTEPLPSLINVDRIHVFDQSAGRFNGEMQLDALVRRYGLVRLDAGMATVVTRSERLGRMLAQAPNQYKCEGNPTHWYLGNEVPVTQVCNKLGHDDPKPRIVRI